MKACLSEKSVSVGPPTSCDVLYYYESLQTATGRHRDAFSAGELHKYYTTGENPFAQNQYAQIKGTDVIIFTMGNTDMEMKLSCPETKADALDTPEKGWRAKLTVGKCQFLIAHHNPFRLQISVFSVKRVRQNPFVVSGSQLTVGKCQSF